MSAAPSPRPDFARRLPADVAARIRATAAAVKRRRTQRPAPEAWRSDDRSED